MRQRIIAAFLILLLTFMFVSCGESGKDGSKTLTGDLAQVGEDIITAADVEEYMQLFAFSQGKSLEDTVDESTYYYVMQTVLDSMISQKVISLYVKDAGIDVLEGHEKDYEEYKAKILADEAMAKLYESKKITDDGIRFIFQSQYYRSAFYDVIKKEQAISEEDLQKYYDEHPDEMSRSMVNASHILVTDKDEADKIYNMLVNDNADFAELAAEYSQDTATKDKGGELGDFGKNETIAEFEKAVFDMKVGEISKPVMTQFGYHIIKLNNAYKEKLDYSVTKSYIEENLINEACNQKIGALLEEKVKYLYE